MRNALRPPRSARHSRQRPPIATLIGLAAALAAGGVWAQGAADAADAASPEAQRIVISATRHAMALIDAPAALSVVPRATLEQLGADNLLEALRGETGVVAFGRAIGGRRTVSLRGMESRHTLYLVDGRRIGASDGVIGHTDFQLGWVAVEEIERIEVLRGPLSTLYGAEAMGGVLQIVTRAPADQFQGSATAEGSWADGGRGGDGHRLAARITGPLGPGLRMALVVADFYRSAVAKEADPRVSDTEGRHKHDGGLRFAWDTAPGHRLDLDLRQGLEERWSRALGRAGSTSVVYYSDTDVRREHGALSWSADWAGGGEWRSQVQAYGSQVAMSNVRIGSAALRPNRLNDDVLEATAVGRPAAAHLLSLGLEARRQRLVNQSLPGGRSEADHRSLFGHDEVQLAPGLQLTGGLRYDEHERFGHVWSPRLYAVWRAAPQWTVKGGLSRGFNPPTLKQITPGYQEDEGPFTYFSDPALQPETSQSVEVGAGWDTRDAGAMLMVFDNRVKNLIQPRFIGTVAGRGQYVFANVDSAHLRGLEATANLRPTPGLSTGATLQFLQATDGNGQRLERRPRLAAGLNVALQQGCWQGLLRVDHVRGQVIAGSVAGQPAQPLPSLTIVGGSLGCRVSPQLTVEAGVSNLTDVSLAQRSPLFTWAELPRTWRLTLRGHW